MPIENAAPGLQQGDAVSLLFANSTAAQAAGKPLMTINQGVSAGERAAVKRSVDASSDVADMLSKSIAEQAVNKQRAIDAVRSGAIADETILRDQQAKTAQQLEVNQQAVDLYGADALEPDTLAAKQAASYAEVRARRLDVQQQILDMQKTDFSTDPFGWIMNQFQQSGVIQQHNQLASIENTLTAEMQASHQMAANAAELRKSLLPTSSIEAQQAAVAKLKSAAELKEIEVDYQMTNAMNNDATSMASLLERRAGQIRSLSSEERQLQAQHIASLNDSIKWEAGKTARQWQALVMEKDAAVEATFERGEQLLGIEKGTGKKLMEDVARTGNHEDYAALVKYFWSGSFADPAVQARVAKFTNYQGLKATATYATDPVARSNAANVLEMTQWINKAQADFDLEVKEGKRKTPVSPEAYSADMAEFTRDAIVKNVNTKVLTITPGELDAVSGGAISKQFPALQAAIALPKEQAGDEQVLGAFREYYKTNGGDSTAAKAFADYNSLRLKTVTDKSLTMQAGVKKPTSFSTTVTVPHPLLSGGADYKLNMTDPAAIERYMLLTKPAEAGMFNTAVRSVQFYSKP